ncbi:MAG: hypothetical protein JST68_00140 [Bacteroidetes bacterium]|nr:hypothetical protein [Bacteroidota bacterium]
MTKTFLRKYWLILTSACCISTAVVLACADSGEYMTSSFTPEIFVDEAYSPFFYSELFYYGIGHDEDQLIRFNNSNVQEWSSWLGKTVKPETLQYLLTTASSKAIDSGATRSSDPKSKAFFSYLQLAKKCEAFSLTPISRPWDEDTLKRKPRFNATTLNRQLQQQFTAATDPFLQQRYWFQLVRSQFFNGAPQDALHAFDSYAQKSPTNTMYYRSLSYAAGAYYKLKQYSKANYYYSLVYQGCNELKTTAHYSFHPQEESDWRGTLALCRTSDEKATLWQMLGIFYSDPNRALQEIYQLNPKSDKLDLLLSRAVNIAEQPGIDSSQVALTRFISRVAEARNTTKPWIWQQAAGYLNTLADNYTAAASWYAKADATTPKTDLPQAQLRLLKLYNTIAGSRTIDSKLEQKLLPELQWLYHLKLDIRRSCVGAIDKKLASLYTASGDKAKAECFVHKSEFFASPANTAALKTFLSKPSPSPYDQLCYERSEIKKEDISEYQAIQYTMADHIDEALAVIKEADSASKTILRGNPFNARIRDCHDCDHEAPQKIKYSKADLIKKLKELKDKIAAGQDVYTNAVLAGNAQYNITQYGNARVFYECKIYGSDNSGPWSIDSAYRTTLISMKTAIRYYTLALSAAKDDEQKAKCQYLLAKCQRNEWYNKTIYAKGDNDFADDTERNPAFIEWDGFKALKQYANTKYYNEVLKECGYFKTYTGKTH